MLMRLLQVMCRISRFAAVLIGLSLFPDAATAGPPKMALVVGNAAYAHVPGLATASNDATDVADQLRGMGYEVTLLTDIGSQVFRVVLDTFAEQARGAETVVFYYAGHAFQRGGVNHLVPVGARLDSADGLLADTWTLDDIAARLKSGTGQVLIFLDACRTAPLPEAVRAADGPGLAQFDGGAGTFVAFATRPGAVAFDRTGTERNSPFTAALLTSMAVPGQSISDMMIAVRNAVDQATDGQQVPWDQSSLRAQVFLVPAATVADDALPQFEFAQDQTVVIPLAEGIAGATGGVIRRVQGGDQMRLAAVQSDTRSLTAVETDAAARITGVDAAARQPVESPSDEGVRSSAAAIPPAPATEKELHAAIQTELKRIGCYAQGIDGDWGRGSQSALERFAAARRTTAPQDAAVVAVPDEVAWRQLRVAPEKTCKPQPVAQTTRKKPAASNTTRRKPAAATTTTRKPAAQAPVPEKKGVRCKFIVVAVVCS